MKYNPKIVIAYFKECGIPEPLLEHKFHMERKWRFDFAWGHINKYINGVLSGAMPCVALEVEGGIWIGGRHNRGIGMIKDMEKYNEAAALGWRVLRVQPKDLCTQETVNLLKRAIAI